MTADQAQLVRGRILLLAEDPGLRAALVPALQAARFEVCLVTGGPEGGAWTGAASADLLIADLADRSKAGWRTWVDLALSRPQVRLVTIATGPESLDAEPNVAGGYACVSRPVDPQRLVRLVQSLLAAGQAEPMRARLLWRQTAPLAPTPALREWGLNE